MGWRAWDTYDQEAQKRFRALPLGERYNWRALVRLALLVAILGVVIWAKFQ